MMSSSVKRRLPRKQLSLLTLLELPLLPLLLRPKREADTYKLPSRESKPAESLIFMLLSNSMLEEFWLALPQDPVNPAVLMDTSWKEKNLSSTLRSWKRERSEREYSLIPPPNAC
jgi:hypothetical protein